MNKAIIMGRLTREPVITYTQGQEQICIARYTLAVDRRVKREGAQNADFISCVVFGKGAEFAQLYLHQGTKIVVSGRIQTGSYTNREGRKVNTTDVVVEEQDFAESKKAAEESQPAGRPDPQQASTARPPQPEEEPKQMSMQDGFLSVPEDAGEDLPFV